MIDDGIVSLCNCSLRGVALSVSLRTVALQSLTYAERNFLIVDAGPQILIQDLDPSFGSQIGSAG